METSHLLHLLPVIDYSPPGFQSDRMPEPLFSHDSQDPSYLNEWVYHDATYHPLHSSSTIRAKSAYHHAPPCPNPFYEYPPSPPPTGSELKLPARLPDCCDARFMESRASEFTTRRPLSRLLTGPSDGFRRPQPPSPPLDTPELVQRALPGTAPQQPLSPPLTSPVDAVDLPPIPSPSSTYPCSFVHEPGGTKLDTRRCCQGSDKCPSATCERAGLFHGGPLLSPDQHLLSPDSPSTSWETPSMLQPSFENDDVPMRWGAESSSGPTIKARGNSLDSSRQDTYDFLNAGQSSSLRPVRSLTTPPNFLSPRPSEQLDDLWHSASMDVDDFPESPRSDLLNFDFPDFDDVRPQDFSSSLLSQSPQEAPLSFFDEPGGEKMFEVPMFPFPDDFEPSSPHSPHMQLLPDGEELQPATISPCLLGLPETDLGLGLDVDGIDRSPSPSDYELQVLEGQTDVPLEGLPDEEFQGLRAYYEQLSRSEATAKERENVLDRRIKDISVLLKPPKASPDPSVMLARRRELRAATDLRIEARKARKEEKRRLRELGALLDLKLDCAVFRSKGNIRSVPQLVANMFFKRHDRTRPLANRKAGCVRLDPASSPLCSSLSEDDLVSTDDVSSMDSMSLDGSEEDERMDVM